jgi:hypothetical protein
VYEMAYRKLATIVLAAGALAVGGGAAQADVATGTGADSTASVQRLTYIGAYPGREACEDAGRQFGGVDYFCYKDYNDGRLVWELWIESNRP